MLISLIAFSPAVGQQLSSNSSQGLIFGLNDSIVNETISKYPFFVLDGYASWCEPCHDMNNTLHQLSGELGDQIAFGTIDVENNTRIAQRYNITHYPTLLIFKNGTLIDTEVGFGSKSELVDLFKILKPDLNVTLVKPEAPPQVNSAVNTSAPNVNPGDIPLINLGTDKPALPMMVDDRTLDFALSRYPFFVLMGFADWCGYCKEMNSTILELSNELKGQVAFGLIDAENNNNTTTKYDISSYPRILIFKNGSLAQTQRGYTEKSKLVELLKKVEPTLDTSHVIIITPSQPEAATTKPAATLAKQGSTAAIFSSTSEADASLKYLDKILNYTQTNRTSGTTINIFIINACPQSQSNLNDGQPDLP